MEHSPDAVPARNAVPLRTGSRRRPTILVESAPSDGPSQAHIADGVVDGALVPLAPTTEGEMALSVPTDSQLMEALQQAEAPDELVRLGQMAAAYLDVSRRCHAAVAELSRLSKFRLRSRHKLGQVIAATVRHGGNRKRSGGSWVGSLPKGLSRAEAKRCRDLAKIEASVLEAYLLSVERRGQVPKESGAHKYAKERSQPAEDSAVVQPGSRRPAARSRGLVRAPELPTDLLDAVLRALGEIDVCVGRAGVPAKLRVEGAALAEKHLRGVVFVPWCKDPTQCLVRLAELHAAGRVSRALVVVSGTPWEPWFRSVQQSSPGWEWCIVTGDQPSVLVAYIGQQAQGFRLVFRDIGPVLASVCPRMS